MLSIQQKKLENRATEETKKHKEKKSKDKTEINKMDKEQKKLIKNCFFVKIRISLTRLNKKKQNRC